MHLSFFTPLHQVRNFAPLYVPFILCLLHLCHRVVAVCTFHFTFSNTLRQVLHPERAAVCTLLFRTSYTRRGDESSSECAVCTFHFQSCYTGCGTLRMGAVLYAPFFFAPLTPIHPSSRLAVCIFHPHGGGFILVLVKKEERYFPSDIPSSD